MRSLYRWNSETRTFDEIYSDKVDPKAPMVRTGEMPPTESPINGQVFTNWTKYKRHLKSHGYAIYPVAEQIEANKNYKPPLMGKEGWLDVIKKAENDVRWGNVEFTELEKEIHAREERKCQEYLKRQR